MMTALASRPLRLAGALLAAGLLAACNGEAGKSKSDFKPVPVTPVIGDVPQGAENAPVTLIEYAALTCHVCRDFAKQVYPRLKTEYIDTGKVRYIYRDYPLEGDPATGKAVDGFGVLLASVARCKGAATYHEMIDGIFGVQADLLDSARTGNALPILANVAQAHGISIDEMQTCIDHQPALNQSIKDSRKTGSDKGVTGTPGIFISSDLEISPEEHLKGVIPNWENISAAIEAKLAGQPVPGANGVPVAPAPAAPATPTPAAPATPPAQ